MLDILSKTWDKLCIVDVQTEQLYLEMSYQHRPITSISSITRKLWIQNPISIIIDYVIIKSIDHNLGCDNVYFLLLSDTWLCA